MSREQYGEKFRQVQHYLHSGDCYQVNWPNVFRRNIREMNGKRLCSSIANRAIQCVYTPEDGAILSLSPERFIQLEDQHIQTPSHQRYATQTGRS